MSAHLIVSYVKLKLHFYHSCPVCRQDFLLGPEGVDGFARNLLVEQLIAEHRQLSERDETKPEKVIQSRINVPSKGEGNLRWFAYRGRMSKRFYANICV